MTIDRSTLLGRMKTGIAAGEPTEALRRRLRLRRDCWEALVDELGASAPEVARAETLPSACACANTGILPDRFLPAARWAASLRPEARWEIDQVHTTVEDLARRAAFVAESGDVLDKDLLFVGDDDFCSLVVCATGAPRRVVVVDVDERVLERLAGAAASKNLPLEVVHYDLGRYADEPMPESLAGQFDAFLTDPPYSDAGSMLFCAFGMDALRARPGVAAYVALPWLAREAWSDELLVRVQSALLNQGFFLSDVRRAFHAYEHADGVVSSYLRAEAYLAERSPRELLEGWSAPKVYSSRRWTMEG
jgi:predicted methyltransferase